jgi:alpha-beta hydrolase superfamily lysophospholipase
MAQVSISLLGIEAETDPELDANLRLLTDRGTIRCRHHEEDDGDAAILWVFGAGGGLGGPAGGVYTRLARRFADRGIASLELAYREPGNLAECVLDTLAGLAWLESRGRGRLVLVGHSFGGAVVLNAAAASPTVVAVAALSSQTAGIGDIAPLSPRPLLFAHGEDDEILPATCSRELYERAEEPKELIIYPACRHGLDDCGEQLDADLMRWIEAALVPQFAG